MIYWIGTAVRPNASNRYDYRARPWPNTEGQHCGSETNGQHKSETGSITNQYHCPLTTTTTTPCSDFANPLNLYLHAVKATQVVVFGTVGTTRPPVHSPLASSSSDARSPAFAQRSVCKRYECILCRGDVSSLEAGSELGACVLE
jgi:hypothetical protein